MEMALNAKQKEFLLTTWFDDRDREKIFETESVEEIMKRDVRLGDVILTGWPKVFVDGEETTCVNANALSKEMLQLVSLGE